MYSARCRLDYCGIAILIMGSFVPWLYYSFFCKTGVFVFYTGAILVLGSTCIVVSMWEKFAAPKFRPVRAGERSELRRVITGSVRASE